MEAPTKYGQVLSTTCEDLRHAKAMVDQCCSMFNQLSTELDSASNMLDHMSPSKKKTAAAATATTTTSAPIYIEVQEAVDVFKVLTKAHYCRCMIKPFGDIDSYLALAKTPGPPSRGYMHLMLHCLEAALMQRETGICNCCLSHFQLPKDKVVGSGGGSTSSSSSNPFLKKNSIPKKDDEKCAPIDL
jgi:hypothetical protein